MARLPRRAGRRFLAISPMPRVDGGLELVTTDGALAERLQRRVRRWPTVFLVRVRGALDDTHVAQMQAGELDDGRRLEGVLVEGSELEAEGANRWYRLTAIGASGKDVRRLFERQGAFVSRIQRTALGPISLTRDLNRGAFRSLSPVEAKALEAPFTAIASEVNPASPQGARANHADGNQTSFDDDDFEAGDFEIY